MEKIILIASLMMLTVAPCMASNEENHNSPVTIDGIKIKLQLTDKNNADAAKMKDKSSVDANWSTSDQDSGYRFYYVRDTNTTHTNCNRVEEDGTIFPGSDQGGPNGSYDKNTKYQLKGTAGDTVKCPSSWADVGSFTVCAVDVDSGSPGEYQFVGSMWLDCEFGTGEMKKIKIVDY